MNDLEQRIKSFARPKRVKDVIRGRNVIKVTDFYEIVPAMAERKQDEIIQIERQIIPEEFYSAQNFSKRGGLVFFDTFDGNPTELKNHKWSELKARIDAWGKYKREQGPFAGWCWEDPEKRHHIVRPSVILEGHRIIRYSAEQESIHEKVKVYSAADVERLTIKVEVPSRSSDETHVVDMEHIALDTGEEKHVEWTRLDSRHDCKLKRNDHTFRFPSTVRYCPHDIAANVAYGIKMGKMFNPLPLFTEPLLRLFMTATHHTLIKEPDRSRRPLSLPEVDTILMDAWLLHGNKQTFFVRYLDKQYQTGRPIGERKRMRDYDWTIDGPSLQFGNE